MKFILLSRLANLLKKSESNGSEQYHQKVVKFEDCERINRERFKIEQAARINASNQVYAAISGNLLSFSNF